MYSRMNLWWRYLRFYLSASNGKGHGIHSPFVFDFVTKILNDRRHFYAYTHIENLCKIVSADPRTKETAGKLLPAKHARLLFRTVAYYAPGAVLELGTSLGIATAYMASANAARVVTVESADDLADKAETNFSKLKLHNITLVRGECNGSLSKILSDSKKTDMVFFNEKYIPDAVRFYLQVKPNLHEKSILILEGIHTDEVREQAWEEIRQQPDVTLTIDLFSTGFVFFRKENKVKQHFRIRF